jgi:hypothetical protein
MAIDKTYQYTPAELTELGRTGSSATYNARIAAYNAPKSGSGNSREEIAAKAETIKVKISDLQKQKDAMEKYGLTDSEELIKDSSGNYVPKKKSPLNAEASAAADIANNPPKPTMAYKDSEAYKSLSPEAKAFVDLGFDTIVSGGETEARQLSDAINNAIAIADPYYAAQLELAKGEIGAAIAGQNNDFETKHRILTQTRDRLSQDVNAESSNLTLGQQADLSTVLRGFDEDILSIADSAADKGLTFATGARSRILAETRRGEQMQDVVQSSTREYNYKMNELRVKAARGDEDAANQLADLERSNQLSLEKIGRTAETVLGSANVPGTTGYTPVGGVIGSLEEQKRKSILSDVGSFVSLSNGFGL